MAIRNSQSAIRADVIHIGAVRRPAGFTLVELLVTISIIGILAGTLLFALQGAAESAKEQKTKALIAKLNNLIMPRYESYRTKRVPVQIPPPPPLSDTNYQTYTATASKARLDMLRELMRLELPDRMRDIIDPPMTHSYSPPFFAGQSSPLPAMTRPAVSWAYLKAYQNAPNVTTEYEGAECLYLIVTLGITDDLGGRALFSESIIGDKDQDGLSEFQDAWGTPIRFLRWAPGFASELGRQVSGTVASGSATSVVGASGALSANDGTYNNCAVLFTSGTLRGQSATVSAYAGSSRTFTLLQSLSSSPTAGDTFNVMDPDPFDPRHVYPTSPSASQTPNQPNATFALYPLIYSAGSNRTYGVITDSSSGTPVVYSTLNNNPFPAIATPLGTQQDILGESTTVSGYEKNGWLDNIHNHLIGTR